MNDSAIDVDTPSLIEIRVEMADRLRGIGDADELIRQTGEILGPFLGVQRLSYAHIEDRRFDVRPGYTAGVEEFSGRGDAADFGVGLLRHIRDNHVVGVEDVASDPRLSARERKTFLNLDVAALCCVALTRMQEWKGLFFVHSNTPRQWMSEEVDLLREAADRIWAAVERERIEAALHDTQRRLSLAQEVARVGTFDWDISANVNRWSPEIEKLYGLPVGSFGGSYEDWRALVHPDDLEHAESLAMAAIESGDSFIGEWRAKRADGTWFWILARALIQRDADNRAIRMIGANIDITEQKENEERLRMLSAELDHRVKNVLAIIQSIATQTLRDAPAEHRAALSERLRVLSLTHGILSAEKWRGAGLAQIVREILAPHARDGDLPAGLDGPQIVLSPKSAQSLALALGELASNSARHGALRDGKGRIDIRWRSRTGGDAPSLAITWRESGGAALAGKPAETGLGGQLVQLLIQNDLGGRVETDFAREGLVCEIAIPASHIVDESDGPADAPARGRIGRNRRASLAGARILLVEDEAIIATDVMQELESHGVTVHGPAATVDAAAAAIEAGDFDAAILDVNLSGRMVWPVARMLEARGIPFAFLTGYSDIDLADFPNAPHMEKPVQLDQLKANLLRLLNR